MGNPFVHTELTTTDTAAAKKFYKALFDWKFSEVPMGPGQAYTMIDYGVKNAGGGIQGPQMEGQPTAWLAYVEVASVKKTVAKVTKLGGKVYQDTLDIGMGVIAVVADPQGAAFGVWEPAKKKPAATKKPAAKKKPAARRKP